ncbi:SURF1 family protein [Streptomyces olivoverticillatus]
MYRFLLTPRWWWINVFVVLAIPFCLFMGSWQLGRFESRVDSHRDQQTQADEARAATAQPLRDLLPVSTETSGRQATATGRYDTGHQLLVPDRDLDDRTGFYVLTLLRTDGGKALPVVRGWLPGDAGSTADTAKVPAPPSGQVTVTGALQASESSTSKGVRASGGLPQGQLGVISAATLVNLVPYGVYDAWITVTKSTGGLTAVPPRPPLPTAAWTSRPSRTSATPASGLSLLSFVVFMWFRLFRREAETARDIALGITPEQPLGPDGARQKRSPAGAA